MSKPIERIKSLIPTLPEKDISLGYKFLECRDFEQLKELVDSAIYKVRRNQKSENPKEKYANISIEDLSKLKSEVDIYISYIDISSNDICDDVEYEIDEEEMY